MNLTQKVHSIRQFITSKLLVCMYVLHLQQIYVDALCFAFNSRNQYIIAILHFEILNLNSLIIYVLIKCKLFKHFYVYKLK